MSRRGGSSARWRARQETDPFVERARREGWRGRAVFKLMEIDRRERLIRRGQTIVDLGAAPGSWCQYAVRKTGSSGRIVAIDLLAMDPIPGVEFEQADFTDTRVVEALEQRCGHRRVDLVLSDMAPNISGNRALDQPRSIALAEDALWFAEQVLVPGGDLLVKLFQGAGTNNYVELARERFARARLVKPAASRSRSREIYLLARGFSL
ncbi:MAG: SAM-dependent methyltransferase [Gammaproteobacteria bacterium]|jgi:23S rRNA (uridine2552-2'-O)-methyltransferase